MRSYELHQVDAFTNELFGGNPAGVVSNAEGLTDKEMQLIAREMNLSETAFVLPSDLPEADMRLRFYTPAAEEIDFCGHATVGALAQLARLGMYGLNKAGANSVNVETKASTLMMTVINEATKTEVAFTAPQVSMEQYAEQGDDFAAKLHVPSRLIHGKVLIDQHLRYIYIPTSSLDALGKQNFDFTHIKQQFAEEGIVVFCLYSNETFNEGNDLHARGLAPLVGVDEDPFTGSMQAGLVHAAKMNGFIPQDQMTIRTEQGNFIGRPGSASILHDTKTDLITVSAQAVPVFSTKLELQ